MTRVTSIQLKDELAERLDALAAALDRPQAWLIEQAIARYVEQEAREIEAISEVLTEYREGTAAVQPHTAVMDWLEARIRQRTDDASPLA